MISRILKVVATASAAAAVAAFLAPAQAADVTLTYLTSQGWVLDAHTALYKKFEAETGIAIDAQIVPADQYYNVLKTKLNSGEGPDIFGGQSGVNTLVVDLNVEKNAVDLSDQAWAQVDGPACFLASDGERQALRADLLGHARHSSGSSTTTRTCSPSTA